MASTNNTTTGTQAVTYAMLVIFTVHPESDQALHDQQTIRDEAQSWIESLDATVQGVCIRRADGESAR
jgi:hypothetical protein